MAHKVFLGYYISESYPPRAQPTSGTAFRKRDASAASRAHATADALLHVIIVWWIIILPGTNAHHLQTRRCTLRSRRRLAPSA